VTAKGADKKIAWENPLMPNVRLRQIYMAMMQARMLGRAVPARQRNNATVGIEACLVSPAIDLGAGDLVSDALAGGVVDFLRGATLGEVLSLRRRGAACGCGEAARLPEAAVASERIWMALGAAGALKAEYARAKIEAKAVDSAARSAGVVVVYALPGEMTPALWRKALTFARDKELPVIFVALPDGRPKDSAAKPGVLSAMSIRCGVPGIAVDGDDAVALYRVAQESVGHARSGGGPALMECVPFVIEAETSKRKPAPDAIAGLEGYLLQRGVATRAWIERQAATFARRIAKEKAVLLSAGKARG